MLGVLCGNIWKRYRHMVIRFPKMRISIILSHSP